MAVQDNGCKLHNLSAGKLTQHVLLLGAAVLGALLLKE